MNKDLMKIYPTRHGSYPFPSMSFSIHDIYIMIAATLFAVCSISNYNVKAIKQA
jgi:hypothetical protein